MGRHRFDDKRKALRWGGPELTATPPAPPPGDEPGDDDGGQHTSQIPAVPRQPDRDQREPACDADDQGYSW